MNKSISSKVIALTFGILVICFLIAFYVVAWQEPTQAPPGGNVAAPLNVSNVGQSKAGGLIVNTGGAEKGLIIDKGKICLGTYCISAWPEASPTYTMTAKAYQQGSTYYAKTISYACGGNPGVVSPIITRTTDGTYTTSNNKGYTISANACGYSTSQNNAYVTNYILQVTETFDYPGCGGAYTRSISAVSSCTPGTYQSGYTCYNRSCLIHPSGGCTAQFLCSTLLQVGQ